MYLSKTIAAFSTICNKIPSCFFSLLFHYFLFVALETEGENCEIVGSKLSPIMYKICSFLQYLTLNEVLQLTPY